MESLSDAFPSDYLKAADLKGQRVNLTIDQVVGEKANNSNEEKPVLLFKETQKKLGLNKTNGRMIAMLLGTEKFSDWRGARITLRPDITNYPSPNTPCIRVDSELPPQHNAQTIAAQAQGQAPFQQPTNNNTQPALGVPVQPDPNEIPF